MNAEQLREAVRATDHCLATAVRMIMKPLNARWRSHPGRPRDDLINAAQRLWVQNIPSRFSLTGPIIEQHCHLRLVISETRLSAVSEQSQWWLQSGAELSLGIVKLRLIVKPGTLSFSGDLLQMLPLYAVDCWLNEHDGATEDDFVDHVRRRLFALETLQEAML